MPLTPNDVHNVVFDKPPVGKRGYNEDQVDAFLDLIEENLIERDDMIAELNKKIAELEKQSNSAVSSNNSDDSNSDYLAVVDVLKSAELTAKNLIQNANEKADNKIQEAHIQAEVRIKEAEDKAISLESDAERKYNEIISTMNQKRAVLEGKIDQLQIFEREYHDRLKATFEEELSKLSQMKTVAPKE